jgi:FixJ family two-component response regulator
MQLTGMSGLDVIAHMRSTRPSWPLIAMSGSDDDNIENEALSLGASVFMGKPLDSQELLTAIETALAG